MDDFKQLEEHLQMFPDRHKQAARLKYCIEADEKFKISKKIMIPLLIVAGTGIMGLLDLNTNFLKSKITLTESLYYIIGGGLPAILYFVYVKMKKINI
jgi:hypothetical protein